MPLVPFEAAAFTLAPLAALALLATPLIEAPFFIEEARFVLTDFADPRKAELLTPLPADAPFAAFALFAAFILLAALLEAAFTLEPLVATPLTLRPTVDDFFAMPLTPPRAALDPPREAAILEPLRVAAPFVEPAFAFPSPLTPDVLLAAGRAVFAPLLAPFEADFADLAALPAKPRDLFAALDAPLDAVLPPAPLLACLVAAFFVALAILMGFK
jgi:hypothetical protein